MNMTENALTSRNSSELIAILFAEKKALAPKTSLASVCLRAGIASRGYLNDVIKGRRTLNRKYTSGLCRALGLKGFPAEYLRVLLDLENELSERKRDSLMNRRELVRKILSTEQRKTLSSEIDHVFCFQLFAAFGLFNSRPTETQLLRLFPSDRRTKASQALDFLLKENCIQKIGETFAPTNDNFMFRSQDWLRGFVRSTINEAQFGLEKWFDESEHSLFESSYFSADREKIREALPRLREAIEEFQAFVESSRADEVVQFSLQIFPVLTKLSDNGRR